MIVRKGRKDGVMEGAGVVYAGGIVGKVQKVYAGTSVIRLVTSPSFRMVATFQGDTQPLYIQGWQSAGLGTPQGRIRNVPVSVHLSKENPGLLVSSSLGGVFPSGLHLGTVDRLEQSSNGLFKEGPVAFPSDLYHLNEVAILVPIQTSN
jgi:rod shape-determining protein MreC